MNQENTNNNYPISEDEKIFYKNFKDSYSSFKQEEEKKENNEQDNKTFKKKYRFLCIILVLLYVIAVVLSLFLYCKKEQPAISLIPVFIGVLVIFDAILDFEYFTFPKSKQKERQIITHYAKLIPILASIVTGAIFLFT